MQWFRNRKTATKLMLAFGLMAALVGFVGYQGIRGMGTMNTALDELYWSHALGVSQVKEANLHLIQIARGVANVLMDTTAPDIEQRLATIQRHEAAFWTEFGAFQQGLLFDHMRGKASEIEQLFKEVRPEQDKIVELARTGRGDEWRRGLNPIRTMTNAIDDKMHELVNAKETIMQQSAASAVGTYTRTRMFIVAVTAVAVALAIGIGVFIAQLLTRPLGQAVGVLQAVAAGDLTQQLDVTPQDEVGQMAMALNRAVEGMRTALQEVSRAAHQAATASQQMAAASEELSSGSQEQASSLEEGGQPGTDHRDRQADRR